MRKRKYVFLLKSVITILIICGVAFFLFIYIGRILIRPRFFVVREIITQGINPDAFAYLKGRNIFSLDLEKESEKLSGLYPTYKKVQLVRVLPDRIFVKFIRRDPVAYVKLSRFFCIDDNFILFDVPQELANTNLPIIIGLEKRIPGAQPGTRCQIKELMAARIIMREINRNMILRSYKLTKIDISNLSNASFFVSLPTQLSINLPGQAVAMQREIEVKIGLDKIRNKLNILGNLFVQMKQDWYSIKYIDLRFKEPVLHLNDA